MTQQNILTVIWLYLSSSRFTPEIVFAFLCIRERNLCSHLDMFHGQTPLVELKYDSYLKLFCQIAQMVNINSPHLLRDMFLSKHYIIWMQCVIIKRNMYSKLDLFCDIGLSNYQIVHIVVINRANWFQIMPL